MPYEPIHHKYRPQTFKDLVGQETIALTLSNALKQEKIATAYLFTGPRGTGKTSSARILAKSLNCLTSDRPTPDPCGKCEACLAIARGSALDVMEIDAASNTGVDNIREIIERSRFAPVQCRYKIYAIDECLTGDSLIQTSEGSMRIDNPNIKGKQVLSYSETKNTWEYKRVLGWLEREAKETLIIKTTNRQIRCTGNHLIRTETGWIEAKNVKEGMRILSPVNVDVAMPFINTAQMEESADLQQDINSKEISTVVKSTTSAEYSKKQKQYDPIVNVDAKNNLTFPTFSKKKEVGNGYRIYNNIQFPQWTTNLERVESVSLDKHEKVYDLEVEDNHNFVANGLLVHNCHMLSTAAFNALLKTLEEPPPQVVFILATTDPQRVLSTIISRCQRFDYRRIPLPEMVSHLKYIAQQEKIAIADDALNLIAQIANGGLRDAESLLDQLSLLPDTISVEKVWDLVGAVPEQDLLRLLHAISSDNSLGVLEQCRSLMDRGREPIVVLQNLASFYLNLLIAKTAPQHPEMVAVTETCWQQLCQEAANWDTSLILQGQQHLKEAETQLKRTTQPRLWLEVTLLGLLPQAHRVVSTQPTAMPSSGRETSRNEFGVSAHSSSAIAETVGKIQESKAQPQPVQQAIAPTQQPQSALEIAPTASPKPPKPVEEAPATVNSPPVTPIKSPKPPAVAALPVTPPVESEPEKQSITRDFDIAEIWQKVVSCLQPPTTQALLKQQCHLVDFDGSSAVVGISSAKLQKLNQGKVPNIEKAFAQVVKQKVKVQLEVANRNNSAIDSAKKNSKSSNSNVSNVSKIDLPTPESDRSTASALSSIPTPTETNKPETKKVVLPPADSVATMPAVLPENSFPPTKSSPLLADATTKTDRAPIPENTVINTPDVELAKLDDEDDKLQKAIANLTHSFEGELVEMEGIRNSISDGDRVDEIEMTDDSELGSHDGSNRPNIEDYDDDW